jgi:hypothetical protein
VKRKPGVEPWSNKVKVADRTAGRVNLSYEKLGAGDRARVTMSAVRLGLVSATSGRLDDAPAGNRMLDQSSGR